MSRKAARPTPPAHFSSSVTQHLLWRAGQREWVTEKEPGTAPELGEFDVCLASRAMLKGAFGKRPTITQWAFEVDEMAAAGGPPTRFTVEVVPRIESDEKWFQDLVRDLGVELRSEEEELEFRRFLHGNGEPASEKWSRAEWLPFATPAIKALTLLAGGVAADWRKTGKREPRYSTGGGRVLLGHVSVWSAKNGVSARVTEHGPVFTAKEWQAVLDECHPKPKSLPQMLAAHRTYLEKFPLPDQAVLRWPSAPEDGAEDSTPVVGFQPHPIVVTHTAALRHLDEVSKALAAGDRGDGTVLAAMALGRLIERLQSVFPLAPKLKALGNSPGRPIEDTGLKGWVGTLTRTSYEKDRRNECKDVIAEIKKETKAPDRFVRWEDDIGGTGRKYLICVDDESDRLSEKAVRNRINRVLEALRRKK